MTSSGQISSGQTLTCGCVRFAARPAIVGAFDCCVRPFKGAIGGATRATGGGQVCDPVATAAGVGDCGQAGRGERGAAEVVQGGGGGGLLGGEAAAGRVPADLHLAKRAAGLVQVSRLSHLVQVSGFKGEACCWVGSGTSRALDGALSSHSRRRGGGGGEAGWARGRADRLS